MLVVYLHPLKPVHLLDFVHQILLELLLAPDVENIVGIHSSIHQRLASPHPVAFMHVDVLASRHQVFAFLAAVCLDNNLTGTALKSSEPDNAVYLGNDGLLLRLASLEQLGNARQPTGDILRFRRLTGDLRQNVPSGHHFSLRHRNMGSGGKLVAAQGGVLLILHRHAGLAFFIVVIKDYLL